MGATRRTWHCRRRRLEGTMAATPNPQLEEDTGSGTAKTATKSVRRSRAIGSALRRHVAGHWKRRQQTTERQAASHRAHARRAAQQWRPPFTRRLHYVSFTRWWPSAATRGVAGGGVADGGVMGEGAPAHIVWVGQHEGRAL